MIPSGTVSIAFEARQHLLHLELTARPAGDNRLGPLLDRFGVFAPVMLAWVPDAAGPARPLLAIL